MEAGWRRLRVGELQAEGDEWWSWVDQGWFKVTRSLGEPVERGHQPRRRRIPTAKKPLTRVTVREVTWEWTKEMGFGRHSRDGVVPLTARDMMAAEGTYNTMRKGLKAGDVLMVEFS